MNSAKKLRSTKPVWWIVQQTVTWVEFAPAPGAERRRQAAAQARARIGALGPDDPVLQEHPRTPRNVAIERAHAVPDNDWEVGTRREQLERYATR
ncbi:MAG TPA: hypothetical protein VNN80_10970 [Polyangiaceae bacterium]|nr:hypothetical protein [Polyangiaceae bacterium]